MPNVVAEREVSLDQRLHSGTAPDKLAQLFLVSRAGIEPDTPL